MLDEKQAIEKMHERGFSETMRSVRNRYDPIAITFCTMRLDGTDISCTVNLEEETFSFVWSVYLILLINYLVVNVVHSLMMNIFTSYIVKCLNMYESYIMNFKKIRRYLYEL